MSSHVRDGDAMHSDMPLAIDRLPDDIVIRPFTTRADFDACIALQETTWGVGFNERVPSGILKLSQYLGGVASGAFDANGDLLGFVFGMSGLVDGRPTHWSDMLAVRPDARDRGIGEALKWHQRETLLSVGITLAQWTFDPLEARNAWLNLTRLGAVSRQYVRDFYDASDSPLHRGLATDRLIVDWKLDAERVRRRAVQDVPAPDPKLRAAPLVNPAASSSGVSPDVDSVRRDLDAPIVRVAIPASIQRIKAESPDLAARWQMVVRESLEHYLGRGYEVTDLLREEEGGRSYALRRRGYSIQR